MMKTKTLLPIFLLCFSVATCAGQSGFNLWPGLRQVEIPYEYRNNFIILKINFSRTFPLNFIFDTGAEHTILSKREVTDLLRIPYEQEVRVRGSDLTTELIAYVCRRVYFDIPDKVNSPWEDILVLNEDYFRFEEYAGVDVHGILSANAFSKYIIKINYEKRTLQLINRTDFRFKEDGWVEYPVEIYRNKIYLMANLELQPGVVVPVKLLVDTGAALPLLVFSDTHPSLQAPANAVPSNIGMGLGGFLEGFAGRVYQLNLGAHQQKGVVTYFQRLDTSLNLEILNKRNGLIGNGILSHFSMVIDYQKSRIWLRPNGNFNKEFVYDRSGVNLIASGSRFERTIVQSVLPDSPGSDADIRPGDELIRIGMWPASLFGVADIQKKFKGKKGSKVRLMVKRGDQKLKKTILLRDLI